MRILFVHPSASMAISDVGRGYRSALERQGHEIRDYNMMARLEYHDKALPPDVKAADPIGSVKSRAASETIVVEALCSKVDMVIIISGLNVHPIALWLLGEVGIPAAVVLTESPYDDEYQAQWVDLTKFGGKTDMTVFTNDRISAINRGWHLLAPSFDPAIHRPVAPNPEDACDVVMVGTGWGERQAFLEATNWNDIHLRIYGVWPQLKEDSPLFKFYHPMVVNNDRIAEMYCSAKICLNFHRRDPVALTPGPRVYEVAGCGAFLLSDPRKDLADLFGVTVPTFTSPDQLGDLVRYYLSHDDERKQLADKARQLVQNQTFDHRAADMISVLGVKAAAEVSTA